MPFVHQILINTAGRGWTFSPNPAPDTHSGNTIAPGDQIFWTNNNSQPHRLIRKPAAGPPTTEDLNYFMAHPIAAGATSTTFVVSAGPVLTYIDSTLQGPTGTINVTPIGGS